MGCRCICDGSPAYSNWREMQIELATFSTVLLVIWIESSCWSASFRLLSSLRWPTRAIQKYKFQYNNTIISIRVQQYVFQCEKNTFLYNNIYSSKDSIPVQNYKFQYRNIFPAQGRGSIISQTSLRSYARVWCRKCGCMLLKSYLFCPKCGNKISQVGTTSRVIS